MSLSYYLHTLELPIHQLDLSLTTEQKPKLSQVFHLHYHLRIFRMRVLDCPHQYLLLQPVFLLGKKS